ncbi:MAG: nucleotidyl transferase AbiEii/AbiGii toxin family protein [Candidatus Latescibacterota bacterium]
MPLHPRGRAARALPAPLYRALTRVFAQGISGCVLVGGTALAGYYAEHRRSDDLDLFTRDEPPFRAAVLAARSVAALGATTSRAPKRSSSRSPR